jgi:murein DD-endopeptidase MepM/ murein hydrolase activator NlpD
LNRRRRTRHTGADFAAAEGDTVVAPNAGTVELVADLYYLGKTVILDHGLGIHSVFGHLSAVDVSDGQNVGPGDRIGAAGATGRVTGPHLHWAVQLGRAWVDPISLVSVLSEVRE